MTGSSIVATPGTPTAATRNDAVVSSSLRERRAGARGLTRMVGAAATTDFSAVPDSVRAMTLSDSHPWRWHAGAGNARSRSYPVPFGARSLADLALNAPDAAPDWEVSLRRIGAAIGRLHATAATGLRESPQGLPRLQRFLIGDVPSGRPRLLRQAFIEALPTDLCDALLTDCSEACAPDAGVTSHGWAGLGRWYPVEDGALGLLGEDMGMAAREHDPGALLAQVVELRFFRPRFRQALSMDRARAAVVTGYPERLDQDRLDREIRLGVTRHLADIVVHADCPDEEPARWASLVASLPTGART